jgi:adenosylcobalamin-dependent ribonucleoside-triphosphate reductase
MFEFELVKKEEDIKPDFGPVGSVVDIRTYRRWLPKKKRRETFVERNTRVTDANLNLVKDIITDEEYNLERSIMLDHMNKLLALPSGRSMWIAGTEANKKHPASSFNCSALAINRIEAFTTVFELLMLGTGVGFRVFNSDINKLPNIKKFEIEFEDYNPKAKKDRLEDTQITYLYNDKYIKYIEVGDSRSAWINALRALLDHGFTEQSNKTIKFNFDSVRPLGERINGFGGTASGHEALKTLLQDVYDIFNECPNDKLRSIDCLDICCAIAKGVVAGNTRRSALICIFEEGDDLLANAKVNLFNDSSLKAKYYRIQSNNTEALGSKHLDQLRAYLESNPDVSKEELWKFIDQYKPSIEWLKQRFKVVANAGDPGFANYLKMVGTKWLAVRKYRPDFDVKKIWEYFCDICTNPCSEIILSVGYKDGKGVGFCNLTTLPINKFVIKKCNNNDKCAVTGYKLDDVGLEKAVRLTVKMAARQTFVDMPRAELDSTQKAERLLGVSITGWIQLFSKLDLSYTEQEELMVKINNWANDEANTYSARLGIERPLMVCCVKPEGCLEKSHIRDTNRGLLTVDEIGDVSKLGFNIINKGFTTTNGDVINQVYNNGLSKVIEIKLNNGRKIVSTLAHPFSVSNNWKNAIDLKIKDVLDFKLDTYNKTTDEYLIATSIKYSNLKKTNIKLPTIVTEDLAWWVASFFANGSVQTKDGSFSFCSGYKEVVQRYVDITKSLFNIELYVKEHNTKDMYVARFNSIDLIKFLTTNGLLKTKDFSIPLVIRKSSKNSLLAFVTGYLDNDGCFKNKGCTITTKNESFARMLQEVGEAIGLSFSCYEYSRTTTKGVGTYFDLQLSRTYSTKEAIYYINNKSIKAVDKPIIISDKSHKNPYAIKSITLLDDLINTYDIEVDDPHWYYQGGIKSHNTGSKVLGSSSGVHWDWAPYYINRIQMGANDALAKTLKEQGFSWIPTPYDLGKVYPTVDIWKAIELFRETAKEDKELIFNSSNAVLFEFPINSGMVESQGSVSASRQLQNVLRFSDKYVDHMVSSTITAKEDEWDNLAEELHAEKNWSRFTNAAFLSYYSGNHPLLPNEEITEDVYTEMMSSFKDSEWVKDGKFYVNEDLLATLEQKALAANIDIDDVDLGANCQGACPTR